MFLLYLTDAADLIVPSKKFQAIKSLDPPLLSFTIPLSLLWMSYVIIKLVDERVTLWRNPRHLRTMARSLTEAVQRSLLEVYLREVKKVELWIGAYLELIMKKHL